MVVSSNADFISHLLLIQVFSSRYGNSIDAEIICIHITWLHGALWAAFHFLMSYLFDDGLPNIKLI